MRHERLLAADDGRKTAVSDTAEHVSYRINHFRSSIISRLDTNRAAFEMTKHRCVNAADPMASQRDAKRRNETDRI